MVVIMNSHNLKRGAIIGAAAAMLSGCGNFAQRISEPIRQAVQLEPNARAHGENYQKMIYLMGRLMMGEEQERADAAGRLGILHDARAVPALVAALKDPSKLVRSNAAWALGEIGDPAAGPALREALNDEDEMTRNDAARALGMLREGKPSVAAHNSGQR